MLKSIIISISILFYTILLPVNTYAASLAISSPSAAIADANSGQLIYNKDAYQQRPPASLTKMMTAIVCVEYGNLDQNVHVSGKAAWIPPSKMYIKEGEDILLKDLLKGALLISANDACVAIAEHVGGDEEYFVYLMNLKAWALCLNNTHFRNTNGLPAKNHYSCAADLARIGMYCLQTPVVKDYVGKRQDSVWRRGREQKLSNTNRLLWSYQGANGIKTGTTNAAGNCLASAATIGEKQFVTVVLRANDRYVDSIKLLNYAFSNYFSKKVFSPEEQLFVNNGKIKIPLQVDHKLSYPFKTKEPFKRYIIPYNQEDFVHKGEKCALLAIVTDKATIWYDMYAKDNVDKPSIYERLLQFIK